MKIAIIAAGGKGKRTGLSEYTSKAALSVGGKTLIERQLDFATASGCSKAIVVARPEHIRLLTKFLPKNHPGKVVFVPAAEEPNGWAGRIEQALPWVHDDDQVLILSCDNVQTVPKAEWPSGGVSVLFTTTYADPPTTDGPVFGCPNADFNWHAIGDSFKSVLGKGFSGEIFTGYITTHGLALRDSLHFVKPSDRGEKEITSLLEVLCQRYITSAYRYSGEYLDVADLESLARIHAKLSGDPSDGPVDIGAGVILRSAAGAVLLTERQDGRGWVMPGGLVDRGEPLARAAARELREEIGVDVDSKKLRLLGVYPAPGKNGPACSVIFHAEMPANAKVHADPHEVQQSRWFNAENAANITIPFGLRAAVDDALAGRELDVRGVF